MNLTMVRILAALPGVVMLVNGLTFLLAPERAVASLGMPMLDGIARSTQLGDFAAFFLATAGFVGYGLLRSQPRWLYAAAWLLALAPAGRIVAFAAHDAAFAALFIGVECVLAAWLAAGGYLLGRTV